MKFMGLLGITAIVFGVSAVRSVADPYLGWIMTSGNIEDMTTYEPYNIAPYFFDTNGSYNVGSPPHQALSYSTKLVADYTSYNDFTNDLARGNVTNSCVMYDPEKWDNTPTNEQANPWTYMGLFAIKAHDHGIQVIQAPARDLAYVTNSIHLRDIADSQTADNWYVEWNIAGAERSRLLTRSSTPPTR